MNSTPSVAASLPSEIRQDIAIQALSKSEPITHLANDFQVGRKFVYQQAHKAKQALDESFSPAADESKVLFHLPITTNWLFQLILGLVLICQLLSRSNRTVARSVRSTHQHWHHPQPPPISSSLRNRDQPVTEPVWD